MGKLSATPCRAVWFFDVVTVCTSVPWLSCRGSGAQPIALSECLPMSVTFKLAGCFAGSSSCRRDHIDHGTSWLCGVQYQVASTTCKVSEFVNLKLYKLARTSLFFSVCVKKQPNGIARVLYIWCTNSAVALQMFKLQEPLIHSPPSCKFLKFG